MDLSGLTLPGGPQSADPELDTDLRDALAPNYVFMGQVGSGGMARIYLARDPALGRLVAVKVLSRSLSMDPVAGARFSHEAQAMAALAHPNVVPVHAVGTLRSGIPYFVMEYVEGGNLADRVQAEGRLSVAEARRILGDVAAALAAAHQRGIVHRDVKPSNVLYDRESGRVLVSDFGVAGVHRLEETSPDARLTREGAVIGSPKYMSPEQLAGDTVTPSSDSYSLGLLAFELLTGDSPFVDAVTPRAAMIAHLREDPPRLATLRRDVDPELDELVARCLSKTPQDRPTCEEVARAFSPTTDSVLEWPPPGLKPLQGASFQVSGPIGLGTLLILAPVAVGALTSGVLDPGLVGPLFFLGIVALLRGLIRLPALIRDWYRGVRLGYGWTTLAEVAADRRGDTGRLIAGAREYVVATPPERAAFRSARLRRAGLELGAVVALGPVAVVGLWLAPLLESADSVALFTLIPSGLLLVLAALSGQAEHRKVSGARRELHRRSAPIGILAPLVEPWYSIFDRLRARRGPGRGIVGRRYEGLALMSLAAIVMVLVPLTFVSVGFMMVASRGLFALPTVSATSERVNQLRPGRAFRLPNDPSITGVDAARLLHATQLIDRSAWWDSIGDASSIAGSPLVAGGTPYDGAHALNVDSLVVVASRGLSAGEQSYLAGFAADPRLPALSRLARATHFDESMLSELQTGEPWRVDPAQTWWHLQTLAPRYQSTREVAYDKVAEAALHTARGNHEAAELALREILSFGLLMLDETDMLIGALIGAVIADIGQHQLRMFYAVTGQEEKSRLLAFVAPIDSVAVPDPARSDEFLAFMADTTILRQLKLESLPGALAFHACGSAPGLILGLPEEVRTGLEGPIRSGIVRRASMEPIFDAILDWEARLAGSDIDIPRLPNRRDDPVMNVIGSFGASVGWLVGHDRLTACFRLMRDLT